MSLFGIRSLLDDAVDLLEVIGGGCLGSGLCSTLETMELLELEVLQGSVKNDILEDSFFNLHVLIPWKLYFMHVSPNGKLNQSQLAAAGRDPKK